MVRQFETGFINGTIGTVTGLGFSPGDPTNLVKIEFTAPNGTVFQVKRVRAKNPVRCKAGTAVRYQFPLIPAICLVRSFRVPPVLHDLKAPLLFHILH